jgi:CO/xanthine dehydrogenase FAD-binding subunit
MGTVAGTLIASDGRSPFAAVMLALDAQLTLLPEDQQRDLGDVLHSRTAHHALCTLPHRLITQITLSTKVSLAYEYVARTPADRPIVTVAAAKWPSGRVRIVVGGWGTTPRLALDAPEAGGVEHAVRNITAEAGDQWGSAEYRQDVAVTLAKRAIKKIEK